jgi:hypothetical protein
MVLNDESGTTFGFHEHLAKILSDDAEHNELDATKEEDDQEKGGIASNGVTIEPMPERPDSKQNADDARGDS